MMTGMAWAGVEGRRWSWQGGRDWRRKIALRSWPRTATGQRQAGRRTRKARAMPNIPSPPTVSPQFQARFVN